MDKALKWQEVDYKELKNKLADDVMLANSDTVLGLFAPITEAGFNRLNELKSRMGKPYLMVAASQKDLNKFTDCNFSEPLKRLMDYCWPGPLTLILKAKDDAPGHIQSADGTVAVRVPKHKALLKILEETGPLFSTSANLAGQPIPSKLSEIDPSLLDKVSIVIQDDSGVGSVVPSTILDCSQPDKVVVIRQGAYDIDTLERVSGAKIIRR